MELRPMPQVNEKLHVTFDLCTEEGRTIKARDQEGDGCTVTRKAQQVNAYNLKSEGRMVRIEVLTFSAPSLVQTPLSVLQDRV
jgi:hypothetical protein